ncbi:MAG TPA: hypothetical protein PK668_17335 [Myxococcota bacterium]|nr:hypothetical protein [Myxococcota bacterium]HRY94924.1 hypothetical protein [Myxococcota bacterium]HSA22637.1 hypothetical protein [Myxococcota bacterium]
MRLRHGSWAALALALALGPAGAAGGPSKEDKREAARLQDEATAAYKAKDYPRALDCVERAHRLTPGNHEAFRQIGTIKAIMGDQLGAYAAYREYVRRCPKCMYAPQVKKILEGHEESGPPARPRSTVHKRAPAPEPAPAQVDEDPIAKAKRLYEVAYVIRGTNPESARQKLREVLRLTPEDHVYHSKALRLLGELEPSEGVSP